MTNWFMKKNLHGQKFALIILTWKNMEWNNFFYFLFKQLFSLHFIFKAWFWCWRFYMCLYLGGLSMHGQETRATELWSSTRTIESIIASTSVESYFYISVRPFLLLSMINLKRRDAISLLWLIHLCVWYVVPFHDT